MVEHPRYAKSAALYEPSAPSAAAAWSSVTSRPYDSRPQTSEPVFEKT